MFQQILALGDAWRVVRMDYPEKEQRVLIRVEETSAMLYFVAGKLEIPYYP
jgi:hypothetical protein